MRMSLIFVRWSMFLGLLYSGWWFLVVPFVAWIVLSDGLLLPVIMAILFDGYYDAFTEFPYVALTVLGCGLGIIILRPYLYTT